MNSHPFTQVAQIHLEIGAIRAIYGDLDNLDKTLIIMIAQIVKKKPGRPFEFIPAMAQIAQIAKATEDEENKISYYE